MTTSESTPYIVIVCGGRNYGRLPREGAWSPHHWNALGERNRVWWYLDQLLAHVRARGRELVLVHGGATGADACAQEWADLHGVTTRVHKADWSKGEGAGPARSADMVREGADMCLAFPGGAGTRSCVNKCTRVGMNVVKVPD